MPDEPAVRLHCFAHSVHAAGAFDGWAASVGPGVQPVTVPLPQGPALRQEASALPAGAQGAPYALYGHGLGALAAFSAARALHEAGLPGPALLAVASCPPPGAGRAPKEEVLRLLQGPHAVPPGSDEGVLLRAVLPALRADLEVAHALHEAARRPGGGGRMSVPLLVLTAQEGPPRPAGDVAGWERWTSGPVRTRTLAAHAFLPRGGPALPRLLGRACRVARRLGPRPAPVG